MIFFPKSKRLRSCGDTIIEVIIGIALLSTAMAAAYVSTTHSLQLGTDSANRDRAGGYLQQQLEMIKYAEQNDSTSLAQYTASPGQHFCIDPKTRNTVTADTSGYCALCTTSSGVLSGYAGPSGNCPNPDDNKIFSLAVVYDGSTKVFTASTLWPSSNGSGQDQAAAFYKLPQIGT